jgi:hypothetical protein
MIMLLRQGIVESEADKGFEERKKCGILQSTSDRGSFGLVMMSVATIQKIMWNKTLQAI